jgi:hypothetical protein
MKTEHLPQQQATVGEYKKFCWKFNIKKYDWEELKIFEKSVKQEQYMQFRQWLPYVSLFHYSYFMNY